MVGARWPSRQADVPSCRSMEWARRAQTMLQHSSRSAWAWSHATSPGSSRSMRLWRSRAPRQQRRARRPPSSIASFGFPFRLPKPYLRKDSSSAALAKQPLKGPNVRRCSRCLRRRPRPSDLKFWTRFGVRGSLGAIGQAVRLATVSGVCPTHTRPYDQRRRRPSIWLCCC